MKIPNIKILIDEIEQATRATEGSSFMTYAHGYLDGLNMALDILEGRVE